VVRRRSWLFFMMSPPCCCHCLRSALVLLRHVRSGKECKQARRGGWEVAHPSPSPDPDERMSRLRLFRHCGSGLRVSPPFSSLGDKVSHVNAGGLVPYDETVVACKSWSTLHTWPAQCLAVCRTVHMPSCAEHLRSGASPHPCSKEQLNHGDGVASAPLLQLRNVSILHPEVALARSAPPMSSVSEPQRPSLGGHITTSPACNATAGKRRPASAPAMTSRACSWTAASAR